MATENIKVKINVVVTHHAVVKTNVGNRAIDEFDFTTVNELRHLLEKYGDGLAIVSIDGLDYGPGYAAADNFENGEWYPL